MAASTESPETLEIDAWRTRLLTATLRLILVLGVAVAVPTIIFAARAGLAGVVALDVLVLTALAILTFGTVLPYRVRAIGLVSLAYLVGVALLGTIGIVSLIYLMGVPVLAAVLLGLRPAIAALVVTGATLVVARFLDILDLDISGVDSTFEWLIVSANVIFVSAVIAVLCASLLDRFERSLRAEQAQRLSLAEQRTRLTHTNARLAAEIAERERAEQRLGHLAAAVEQADDIVLTADTTGSIVYANPVLDRLTGTDRSERSTDHLADLPSDVEVARTIMDSLVAGRDWTGTVRLAAADGTYRELDTRIAAVHEPAGPVSGFVAVLRDVTEARALDARLHRAERLQALATLASGTAHDFNNVLGAILAVAESTRQRSDDPATRHEMVDIIQACARAQGIVEQMMALGRRPDDSGRHPVRIRASLDGTLRLVRAVLPANVELVTDLRDDGVVIARMADLDQIVTNLATNAAQAMVDADPARLTLTLERSRPDGMDSDRLVLRVSDTGIGMDAETLSRIFDPFFTTREDGTGLGLASVQAIVSSLGGEIAVDSRPGDGTTFAISLPVAAREPEEPVLDDDARVDHGADVAGTRPEGGQPRTVAAPSGDGSPPTGLARILLVDDEPLILEMTSRSLEHLGYVVTTARSGDEARERFDADPDAFDVLVTDLSMPGMAGTALVQHVHRTRPDLAAILCSGYGDIAGDDLRQVRLHAYLAKPYTIAELAARVGDAAIHATPRGD